MDFSEIASKILFDQVQTLFQKKSKLFKSCNKTYIFKTSQRPDFEHFVILFLIAVFIIWERRLLLQFFYAASQ